ncbi:MAG TPA: metallophosphoesterase, partial [Flavisolibacter sp.]
MKTTALIVSTAIALTASAQIDSISQRIFLVGDAGGLQGDRQPVVEWISKNADWNDEKNVVLYLGDNIYPLGLPMEGEATYAESKKILDAQINLVRGKKGRAFFVLGNHDWANGKLNGWQQAINQQNYINGLGEKNIQIWPTEGCPGPVAIELSEKVVSVFIDSQWFLYVHEKPGPGSTCQAKTIDEFATELTEIAHRYPNQLMLVVMHHPMYTFGVHGGDYTWKEHIFPFTALNPSLYIPLPVIGSIYPITRGVFGNLQDVQHPLYRNMVNEIERVMKNHPNPLHVSGHEHSLQMIIKDTLPYIVSGSAYNLTRVRKEQRKGKLIFSDVETNGFVMLEIRKSGAVSAKFYNLFSKNLSTPNFTYQLDSIIQIPEKISRDSIPQLPDSIMVVANKQLKASALKRFFMGRNYREEWTTAVKVPVLDMGVEQGGLTPEKAGGGKQTKSLRVVDKTGKEWALRSIQKFPEAAIPPDLRSPFAVDVVEDGVSASYPYAALSIPPLAQAAGVPTLRRKLVYIPDDPRLGRFRSTFKNTLAMLEEREPENITKTDNTDEVIIKLARDNDDHIDQAQVLRARLLDNFYMDLDRHEDQWRWATRDTGKGKLYFVIPRDQDQAFFINQGILPYFIKKPWLVPELQGLDIKADNIKTFNRAARNFDRFFLTGLDENQWRQEITRFVNNMTDSVITSAIRRQPPEVRDFHGQRLINTLQGRRQHFMDDMMEYYRFISRRVSIAGSNQRELFLVDKQADGKMKVTVNKIDKEGKVSSKMYERIFDPEVTKELRLYGLEDNDSFVVRGGDSPIKMRIIGGPGNDHFANEGSGGSKMIVYDVAFEESRFSGNHNDFAKRISRDPRNNQYNRIYYKYNIFHPGIRLAYNIDDKLFAGIKLDYTRHGFRKEPYGMRQIFNAGHAVNTSSWFFNYQGEFIKAIGVSDLLLRADVRAPINVTNFFGLGNETSFNEDHPKGIQYYRARYNIVTASALVRRQMQSWMRLMVGPTFQAFRLDPTENVGRFVSDPTNGLDQETLYKPKTYAGAEFLLDINSRNNQVIPTRGFKLDAGVRALQGLKSYNNDLLTRLHWDMSIIASFVTNPRYVFATRLGYYKNIGNFEFPQANYLSGTENLR